MRIPQWLTLGVAGLVVLFGLYRIRLAMRAEKPAAEGDDVDLKPRARGIYNMSRRSHIFVGIIYLLLGGALIATSFGFNPFGSMFGPGTETPAKDNAPTSTGVPHDGLPDKH